MLVLSRSITASALEDGKTLTYTLATDRSGLILTPLTVTMAPSNAAMPLLRMISARSFCSSLATFSCLVDSVCSICQSTFIMK